MVKISKRASQIIKSGIRGFTNGNIQYDLTIGQPDFDVPLILKESIKKAVDHNHNGYITTGGEFFIRELIISHLKKQYPLLAHSESHNVIITSGVTGGLYSAFLTLLNNKDEVLLADPYFSPYLDIIKLAGGTPKLIDTYPDFMITAQKIETAITSKSKILLLNSPNNPTGKIIPYSELVKIVQLCKKHNIIIFSDEIYESYIYNGKYTSIFDITDEAVVFRGFSKSHGATGWRIGYLVAPIEIATVIERIQGKIYVSAPSITHYTIPEALDFDNQPFMELLRTRRDTILSIFKPVFSNFTCDGGFFAFLDITGTCNINADAFIEILRKKKVAVLPGRIFSKKNTHCRISLTCDTNKLRQAAEIINESVLEIRSKV